MKNSLQTSQIGEFIRVAEHHISAHEFDLAMDQLEKARRIEPGNFYINAIVERIHRLASEMTNGGRFLSITVGDEFDDGIKLDGEHGQSAAETETRVRKLTDMASELFRRGAYETAFDSLMNAYLLDPVSPSVMETERTILPALEMLRRQRTTKGESERMSHLPAMPGSERRVEGPLHNEEEARRLEELKRQREQEREEKERAVWREASRIPRIFEQNMLSPEPPKKQPAEQPKETSGFFTKLRRGKLLG